LINEAYKNLKYDELDLARKRSAYKVMRKSKRNLCLNKKLEYNC